MTLRVSDLQSDSDLDSIGNSWDVLEKILLLHVGNSKFKAQIKYCFSLA